MSRTAELEQAPPRRLDRKPVYFTICAANYLQFAITLGNSLRQADPDAEFVIFLADEPSEFSECVAERFAVVPARRLGITDYDDMAFKYSILEFNTSIKPFCFDYVFDVMNYPSAVYLDPDICVLKPLHHVEAALAEGASCVLTPHATQPITDGRMPDDTSFLLCGAFNLGFIALDCSPDARRFNRWWGEKLRVDCFVALERGVFVDQKYLDLAPSFIASVKVLRHPGYNVAYWNLVQRQITEVDGEYHANGEPLHFVHFSGINLLDRESFSRHQARFVRKTLAESFQRVFDEYFVRVSENNRHVSGASYTDAPYAYDRFKNGMSVTPVLRRVYQRYRLTPAGSDNPFEFNAAFFLVRSDAVVPFPGVRISRLLYEVWKDRADLQKVFKLETRNGQIGLIRWGAKLLKREYAFPDALIEAAPEYALDDNAAPDDGHGFDDLLKRALTSRTFMMVNWYRCLFMGKEWTLDYWRRHAAATNRKRPPQPYNAGQALAETSVNSLSIHGFFQLETGTGQIARGFARAMLAAGHPVSCHRIQMAGASFEKREPFPSSDSHVSSSAAALICLNADATQHLDRHIPPAALASKHKIGHWVWELAELPGQWLGALSNVDEVWTPTRFVANAVRVKTRKPVRVIPYVVDRVEQSSARARAAFGLPTDRLLILMALDFNSYVARKNPIAAVKASLDAFGTFGPSSPMLVIKCHGRKRDDAELKRLVGSHPGIVMIDEVLSDAEMCTLQNACDIFLSLHRAEGFGLNIAECMSLGKLAIATGYSGNEDFMNASNSVPLPYDLIPVGIDQYIFGEGQHWAEPRHDDVVDALRWNVDHFERTEKLRTQARADIARKFSPEAIGFKMVTALADA